IRQSLGWTQDRLAKETQISKSFLSEIENHKSDVSGDKLLKIANALNASLDYLMKGEPLSNSDTTKPIEIPPELSEMADEHGLTYRGTITLLNTQQSLIARRSTKINTLMTKDKWKKMYESLKPYLE
ncbi:MAG TPA: XRE family transcriptional regulator, partial [Desulfobacterales bacterium]|nr:XRE family transcriptional regulator [Desulfobacterales bacterium]